MAAGSDFNPRRVWWAIGIGTIVQAVAFGSRLLGTVATQSSTPEGAGPAFALGFALVPVVCAIVAFTSGHPRAPLATLKGMGIWLVVALPLGLINPVSGLCAGFTASGAVTLRSSGPTSGRVHAAAVVLAAVYVTLLIIIVPQAGIFAGAVTPLLAVKAADVFSERGEKA